VLVLEADTLIAPLYRGGIKGLAEGALLSKSELESEGILYHSFSSSSSSLLERLAKEGADSNSLLDNPKLGKLNKSNSIKTY
jgi:hypothetical protein